MPPLGDGTQPPLIRLALARVGQARIRAVGTSMMPTIMPSTTLTIEPYPFAAVLPGKVVAYQNRERVIVHRVMEREPDMLLTLGDNLPLFDPPVYEPAYLGVVRGNPTNAPPRPVYLPPTSATPPVPLDDSTVTVWVVVPHRTGGTHAGQAERDRSPRLRIRHVSAVDLCRTPFGGAADPQTVRVGVSPAGALPAASLLDILTAARDRAVHVSVGCDFGEPGTGRDGTPVLAPCAADFHVRLGAPFLAASRASTVQRIGAIVRRSRSRAVSSTPSVSLTESSRT